MKLLGIDIGGTKTAACVGTDAGQIVSSARMVTDAHDSLESYYERLKDLCEEVLKSSGTPLTDISTVGISAPGPLSVASGTLIAPPNNPGWHDVPIVKTVKDMFGLPVCMNNDANAAALAEYMFGEHKGVKNMVYLTLSTGMGAGIIVNGEVVQGVSDMGGEVGHHTLVIDGERCGCGRRGCWEAYVGGRSVAERLKLKIREGSIDTSIVEKVGGNIDKIDFRAFAEAARDGDAFAAAEWEQFTERLAQGVGNVIMILNPEVVLLGTIAVYQGEFVLRPLRDKLRKYAWEWSLAPCKIAASSLGAKIETLPAIAVAAHASG